MNNIKYNVEYKKNNKKSNKIIRSKTWNISNSTTTTTTIYVESLWLWLTVFLVLCNCPLSDLRQHQQRITTKLAAIKQNDAAASISSLSSTTTTTKSTTSAMVATEAAMDDWSDLIDEQEQIAHNDKVKTHDNNNNNDDDEEVFEDDAEKAEERAKNILETYKFAFKQNVYNVSIPENSIGKTYATVSGEELLGIKLPHVLCDVKFRIISGDKDKLFKAEERLVGNFAFLTIRTRTSNVVLNREKNDHYTLRVRAIGNCMEYKNYDTETLIHLYVLDRNDLSPLFYPTSYETIIPEDTPIHSSIIRVLAEDADIGINGEIYYSFYRDNDYFIIHPTSGIITLMRTLRFNEYSRYELIVLANDRGSAINHYSNQATKANVTIIIEQVNLFSPEIYVNTLTSFTSNVSALIYGIVRVTDRDDNRHGNIRSLDIVDGNPDGRFSIRPTQTKGEYYIQINKIAKLYNYPYIYNLTLRAEDNGIPPRASYKQVPIHFIPETNTIPIFTKQIYEITIAETSPPNMPVIRLKVSDPNMGNHALVYLEIVGGNEGGEFRINPETGMLYTQKLLDAEKKAFYTLTVSAIDQANVGIRKQSSAKVKINIQDMNDNNPIFEAISNTTIIINENEASGTYVTKLNARDKDLGENSYISYSIANLNDVPFEIDHFTGIIRTSLLLDYETMRRVYNLRIRASDWGLPYRRQTDLELTIKLHDINDNRPQFERINCHGKILRSAPVGTDVFTLSAIDFDTDDFITYRLMSGNEDGCFNLDPTTGVISIGCDLSAIIHEERVINVSATDGTHFSDDMAVHIRLLDVHAREQIEQLDATLNGGYGIFECRETGVARRLAEILAAAERSNANESQDYEEESLPHSNSNNNDDNLVLLHSRYGDNSHTPEFIDFPQELKVNESVALGTSIATIRARDRDLGYNGKLIYAISDGDTDSVFRIDPDTGELQIIGYMDRERQDEYVLNITVYDLGQPQKYISKMIPISILDCNDNKPIYEKSMASFRLTESAINGTVIFCLNASDADLGANGDITYEMQSELSEFYVNATTGCVRLRQQLDREKQETYEFHVIARDHGMPSLSAEAVISILVEDINDNAPIFGAQDFIFKVREDVPRGTVVAAMEVTDFDFGTNGEVQFILIHDDNDHHNEHELNNKNNNNNNKNNSHSKSDDDIYENSTHQDEDDNEDNSKGEISSNGLFKIDRHTGVIRTQGYLDYETRQVHNLIVSAIDGGTPSLTTNMPIVIEVIDVNENRYSPEFDDFVYTARIKENKPIGTIVKNITARDLDVAEADAKIAYSIRGGDGLGIFGVNDFGSIRTLSHLDAESKDSYWLTLCAQDHAIVPLSSCVQIFIEVENINDNVPMTNRPVYYKNVPEGSAPNLTIMHLEAIDADNDPLLEITYNIISGNAEKFFIMDSETGELKTSEHKLDRENQAEHILEISVKDNGVPSLSSTTRVVITVTDINDNTPTFDQRFYKVLVPSTVTLNETIYQVQAFDNDIGENGRITYYIKSGKGKNKFYMNPHNGFIHVTKPLDVETEYDLNIRAEDNGTPKRHQNAKINIAVRDIGSPSLHAPIIKTLENVVDVTESDRPGFLLTLIQAIDEDGDHLWYNISAGDERKEFYIGRDNGNILLSKSLDWEIQKHYNLSICVTDGTHRATTNLYVRVVDTNDNRPVFTQNVYHVNISENIEEEAIIMQLHATDDDEDKKIFYTLYAAQDPASMQLFSIDSLSGNVLVNKRLDYEQNAHHVLIAMAKDQGTPAKRNYAKIIITVHDHNDHAPEFSSKLVQCKIPESSAIGSRVVQLYARDADSGKNADLRFDIITGNVGNIFDIDDTLGTLTLAKVLNMNDMQEYMLQVKASDLGEPSLSAQMSVHIIVTMAENDPPRFFAPIEPLEMYENLPAGTFVKQVEARSSSTIFYEILAGNDSAFFHINPSTGVIVTNNNIDYEAQKNYNLTIRGTNMASASAQHFVIIHILDVNDNSPLFTTLDYYGEISESSDIGTLVQVKSMDKPLLLKATDADIGTNAMLEYRIMDDIARQYLHVESSTGAIKLKRTLDYETINNFHFEVMVFDMGTPKLYAKQNAIVNISVLNVNDCAPKFLRKELNTTLYLPTYENVIVAQVNATDADDEGLALKERTVIRYDIVDGNTNRAFGIDQLTGIITTRRTDGLQNFYMLRVRASDGLYSSILQVGISVESTETTGFNFRKNIYRFSAMENSTKIVLIGLVNVVGNFLHENVVYDLLNPTKLFEIGSTSGAIKTTGEMFDREQQEHYELVVQAKSMLYHNNHKLVRRALAMVHINILDANDNCPIFVNLPYLATVSIDDIKGSTVTQVKAVDLDSFENGEVRYELKRGNGELFKIDRKSGEITLRQSIDGHIREYEIIVAAYDNAITPCSTDVSVHIKVVDRSMPVFDKQFYTDTVREDIDVYTALSLSVQAHSPLKRKLIFTIEQGNDDELFEIDYRTAVFYVVNELDYEAQQSHELLVRATDSVSGINAEVTVSINVVDANDCYPEIEKDNYNITLSENSLLGTQFLKINATDCDTQTNSELSYFIETINGRNDSDLFYIDMNEGTIFLKNTLDYELQQNYHVVVVVKDHGKPSLQSKTNVWISVRDLNDNAPRFVEPSFSCRMSVSAVRGQFVTITQAHDLDEIDSTQLLYKIIDGNDLQTYSMQSNTGVISLLNMQNFTDHQQTILNVSVSDGVHTNYARVKIMLLPENVNSPIFMRSIYVAHVRENQNVGTHVVTVQATDEDFGKYAKINYEIVSDKMHNYFNIDGQSGSITTMITFDREQRDLYELLIKAVDGGGKFSFAIIKIKIDDENDNAPYFDVDEYRTVIKSNISINSTILQIKSYDSDDEENSALRYSIDANTLKTDYMDYFAIGATDGLLSIKKSAENLLNERLQFFVRATDGGKLQKHSSVAVTLEFVAANLTLPEFEDPSITLQVLESTAPGTVLHKLRVKGNYSVKYARALKKLNDTNAPIFISETGDVFLAQPLDRESQQQLHIVACVETQTMPALYATLDIYVQILDENDNYPHFDSSIYHVELPENMPAMSSIIKISAKDKDASNNGDIRYAIENDTHSVVEFFEIDMYSGWITTLTNYDRELKSEYFFDVLARDNGNAQHVVKVPVIIKIIDYNDNAPQFKQTHYNISVAENARPGTVLMHFLLTDKDAEPQDVSYYIVAGDMQAHFQVGMRSGELFVAQALDREKRSLYELQLLVTDGKYVNQTTVLINVTDVNDHVPYCMRPRYKLQINESVAIGTALEQIVAHDLDVGAHARLRYYLTGNGSDDFSIDKDTGMLHVARLLDRETSSNYILTAHAQDGHDLWRECNSELHIQILDLNDNSPEFSLHEHLVSIYEDAPVHTLVTKVHASDRDMGKNRKLRYDFVNSQSHFNICSANGIIKLIKPLDREQTASYNVSIRAQDAGQPALYAYTQLIVNVLDINDNPPEFTMKQYVAYVLENVNLQTVVVKLHATSKDVGVNAEVMYYITAGNEQQRFQLNACTGEMSVRQTLDYEKTKHYFLTVQAIDGGTPPLSQLAYVNISVLDVNDNQPQFRQDIYRLSVPEDAVVGQHLLQVQATDEDSSNYGTLKYALVRGDRFSQFHMHTDSGNLSVARALDRETIANYNLELQACDGGEPQPLCNYVQLYVQILDINDNVPLFEQDNYTVWLQENKPLGHIVLQFNVSDADETPNGAPYTYDLRTIDEGGFFRLEPDGTMRTAARFNHQVCNYYALLVRVFDSGTPPLYSDAWVHVHVIEESQYPPVIIPLEITVNSYEDDFNSGAQLGRIYASDQDKYDTLYYDLGKDLLQQQSQQQQQIISNNNNNKLLFNISHTNGTLYANDALDIGLYRINVTVSDGKFTSSAIIKLNVELITAEMLRHAAIIKFSKITAEDFILSYRKGFMKTMRAIMRCRQKDIVLITLQQQQQQQNENHNIKNNNTDSVNSNNNNNNLLLLLDVVFTVRKQQIQPTAEAYYNADEIRSIIMLNMEDFEEQTNLHISQIPAFNNNNNDNKNCAKNIIKDSNGEIPTTTTTCNNNGKCHSSIMLKPRIMSTYTTDVISFVTPHYVLVNECICSAGYGGRMCEQQINACSSSPCPLQKQCWPADSTDGYQCICPRGYSGVYCEHKTYNINNNNNINNNSMQFYNSDNIELNNNNNNDDNHGNTINAVSFSGKSYAHYKLNKSLAKNTIEHQSIYTLRIRTVQQTGTLLYASGKVDYNILEVVNGAVQYRFDLGSGEGIVGVSSIYVADGAWHHISVERILASAKLIVDGKHMAQGSAPGVNGILNIQTHDVFVGAEVRAHAAILGYENIQRGFIGCMSDIRIALEPLPLYIAGGSAIAALKRFNNVDFNCDASSVLMRLGVCGAQPCLNGGVCSNLGHNNFACLCQSRFSGARCEMDMEPCASSPCLFGGRCVHLGTNNYTCICPVHLSGRRCEYGKFCTPNPCQNGGICEEGDGMPHCMCRGYTGHTCELDVDECENQPCGSGATCINEPGSFRCICPAYLTGASCGDPLYANSITSKLRNLTMEHFVGIAAGIAIIILVMLSVSCSLLVRRHKQRRRNRAQIVGKNSSGSGGNYKEAQLNSLLDNKKNKYSNRHHHHHHHHGNTAKLSNLEVNLNQQQQQQHLLQQQQQQQQQQLRPMSYATANDNLLHNSAAFVNNLDILRSYGSAGDELENIPVEYQKINRTNNQPININAYNLSETELSNKHDWCNQMQLKTFSENKLNNERKIDIIASNNRLVTLKPNCGKLIHVDVPNVCRPMPIATTTLALPTTTAAGITTTTTTTPLILTTSTSNVITPSTSTTTLNKNNNNTQRNTQSINGNEYTTTLNATGSGQYHWDCSDWVRKSQNPLPDITEVPGAEIADSSSLHSNDSNESKPRSPYNVQNMVAVDPARDMTTLNEDLTSEYVDSELESCLQPFELPLIKSKSISRLYPQSASENEDYKINMNKVYLRHPNSYLPSMSMPSETDGESSATEAFMQRTKAYDQTAPRRKLSEEEYLIGNLRRNNHQQQHHHHHHHHHQNNNHNSSQSDLSVHLCEIEDSELEEFLPQPTKQQKELDDDR